MENLYLVNPNHYEIRAEIVVTMLLIEKYQSRIGELESFFYAD